MPPRSDSLNDAIDAIAQGRYSEAIEVLEMYEQLAINPQSEQYIKVRKGLVEAYHKTGNQKKAEWLCQQLAANKNPDVQAWSQQMIDSMNEAAKAPEPTDEVPIEPFEPYLTPEQSEELLTKGSRAYKGGRYVDAVKDLEEFCRGSDASTKNYFFGQTYLVKAYQANGQLQLAIAFAEKMAASNKEIMQAWGKKFLESSSQPPADAAEAENESMQRELEPPADETE